MALMLVAPVLLWAEQPVNEGLGPPPDEVQRTTPREAVVGYLRACRAGQYGVAAHYLDLGEIPASEQRAVGARLARRFKIVLDRNFWVNPAAISDEPAGSFEADLGIYQEALTTITTAQQEIPVLLAAHPDANGTPVWTFDRTTVEAIDLLYQAHGFGRIGDLLPSFFFTVRLWEVVLWQWCGLVVLVVAGWFLSRLLAPPLMALLRRATGATAVTWDDTLVPAMSRPLRLTIIALFLLVTTPWLHLAKPAAAGLLVFWKLLTVLILGLLLSSWVNVGVQLLERIVQERQHEAARSFVPIFGRVARVMVWSLVVVVGLDVVGVEVMALVAGLGIGGLAIAFAAQRTIENLFGSLAIAADRPFVPGDYVTIGGTTGTVEEVGLRSTRIRTSARTVVSIPNRSLVSERVENYSDRDRYLLSTTVKLLPSATAEQVEYVIDETKKLLRSHPLVSREVARVRLAGFGDAALEVAIFTWITTTDYHEYTAVNEQLCLGILRIVAAAGTALASPAQTVHLLQDGNDTTRAEEVAALVAERRQQGELWLPEPPPEVGSGE